MTLETLIASLRDKIRHEARFDADREEHILDVHLEGGRNQEVRLFTHDTENATMLRIVTSIGSADDFNEHRLRSAMEVNASLNYGSLAIFEGDVVLTANVSMGRTDIGETAEAILYMTRMADTYEKLLFGLDRS